MKTVTQLRDELAVVFDQLQSGAGNVFSSPDAAGKFVGENYGKIGMPKH